MPDTPACNNGCGCAVSAKDAPEELTHPGVASDGVQLRSTFRVPKMDCAAEEQMIRLSLADAPVVAMDFDLPNRRLVIDHACDVDDISRRLAPLNYGAELLDSRQLTKDQTDEKRAPDAGTEARVLWILLAVNALMFLIELGAGWWAKSAGLISDAADMFADAAVYGVALYAVGRDARHKLAAARLSGVLQLLLGAGALAEAGHRVIAGVAPGSETMIGISLLALIANIYCLYLITPHRDGAIHMRASYIFSANDVLANIGVIVAGLLVTWTASPWPDWIIGGAIGIVVLGGGIRILRL